MRRKREKNRLMRASQRKAILEKKGKEKRKILDLMERNQFDRKEEIKESESGKALIR